MSLSDARLRIVSATCCSLPHAESRPQAPSSIQAWSYKRAAVRRLDVSESQKNLSDGVIR